MNDLRINQWEDQVQKTAESFPYPPTPPIAQAVSHRLFRRPARVWVRRFAWAIVVVGLLLFGLLAVPPVRAALWQLFQVGAIQIFVGQPPTPPSPNYPGLLVRPSLTPTPVSLADIAGQTNLNIAQGLADFELRLPPEMGLPDKVYFQELPYPAQQLVIFVWLEPKEPQQARLTLYQIKGNDFAFKHGVELMVQEAEVNGEWAVWATGAHILRMRNGRFQPWLFVEGNVLIWVENSITYRLESGMALEQAIQLAESLAPLVVSD